jgi:hypothetical protein
MGARSTGKRQTMMHPSNLLIFMTFLAFATPAAADTRPCGTSPTDWCPAPSGDRCGRHRDVAACRADPACVGMPYRGESVVACLPGERGFSTNCPTVGCISAPKPPR